MNDIEWADPTIEWEQPPAADTFNKGILNTIGAGVELVGSIPGAIAAGLGATGTLIGSGGDVDKALRIGRDIMADTTPSGMVENLGKITGSKTLEEGARQFRESGPYKTLIEEPFGALVMGTRDLGSAGARGLGSTTYEGQERGADVGELALIMSGAAGLRGRGGKARKAQERRLAEEYERKEPTLKEEAAKTTPEGTIEWEAQPQPYQELGPIRQTGPRPQDPYREPTVYDPLKEYGPAPERAVPEARQATISPEVEAVRIGQMEENTRITEMRGERPTIDFPLRQEAWERDPHVYEMRTRYEAARAEGAAKQAERILNEAKTYAKDAYNITKPEHARGLQEYLTRDEAKVRGYEGSMWLDKPTALPIERAGRKAGGPEVAAEGRAALAARGPLPLGRASKGPRGRQRGTIDFRSGKKLDDFLIRKSASARLNPQGIDIGPLPAHLNEWSHQMANKQAIDKLIENGVTEAEFRNPTPEIIAEYDRYMQEALDNPDFVKQSLANSGGFSTGRTSPVVPLGSKGKIGRQRGTVDLSKDPEFLKFKDSLPDNMKQFAKGAYKELQKIRAEKLESTRGKIATTDKAADAAAPVLDKLPGLKKWSDEIAPIELDTAANKAIILTTPDIPKGVPETVLQNMVAGLKLYSFGRQNHLLRLVAQEMDGVMREANNKIHDFILDKTTGFKAPWDKLSDNEVAQLWNTLRAYEGKADLTRAEMFDLGLNEKQVDAAMKFRESLDKVYNILNEARALIGKKPIEKRLGYIPSRFRGDWIFDVKDKEGTIVHRVGAASALEAKQLMEWFREKHPEYDIGTIKNDPMHRFKSPSDVNAGYQAMLEVLAEEDPRVAALESTFQEYMAKQAYDVLNVKKHFMNKAGVGGAEGNKMWKSDLDNAREGLRSVMNYMDHGLKWAELQKRNKALRELLSDADIRKAQPEAVRWANAYINQALGRPTKMAEHFNGIISESISKMGIGESMQLKGIRESKKFATMFWLGFMNLGFSFSQIVQIAQTNPAWARMLQNKGAPGGAMAIARANAAGGINATLALLGFEKNLGPLAKEAWKYAKDYRLVEPKILEEIRTGLDRQLSALEKGVTWNMTTFEKGARTYTYMMWVDFLHGTGEFAKGDKLFRTAAWLTDMTMVDYRPHERALFYKQMGNVGESANALTTFKHNFYSQLWAMKEHARGADLRYSTDVTGRNVPTREMMPWDKRIKDAEGTRGPKGGYDPIATVLGTTALLSGVLGLPGRDDLDGIIRLWNMLGKTYIPTTREIAMMAPDMVGFGGLSAVTGTDWSGKFSMANVVPDNFLSLLMPVAGQMGTMLGSLGTAIMDPSKTNLARAFYEWLPNTGKRLIGDEYFTTDRNILLDRRTLDGTVNRNMEEDRTIKSRYLGLKPLSEAREQHSIRTEKERRSFEETKRSNILKKVAPALLEQNIERLRELGQEYVKAGGSPQEFVNAITSAGKGMNTTAAQRRLLESINNPQRLKGMMERQR